MMQQKVLHHGQPTRTIAIKSIYSGQTFKYILFLS